MSKHSAQQQLALPTKGFVRQATILPVLGFSASTLWRRVKKCSFPQPIKLSERVTVWRAEDIHAWIDAQGKAA